MAYADIGNKGYHFGDEDRFHSFFADDTHRELFDYITKDLSSLPHLLEKYIAKRISLDTLDPISRDDGDDEILQIREILFSTHPYYRSEYRRVILNALGDYFNSLLNQLILEKGNYTLRNFIDEEWYFEHFISLLPTSLLKIHRPLARDTSDNFYIQYKKMMGEHITGKPDEDMEIFIFGKTPAGFITEIQTQRNVSEMLYFIFDMDVQDINTLSTSQRAWLFQKICYSPFEPLEVNVRKKSLFYSPIREADCDIFFRYHEQKYTTTEFNTRDFSSPDLREELLSAIEYVKANPTSEIYERYEIDNIRQLLYLEILSMIQSDTMIRKCRNCGRYFVVKNRNVAYCDRLDESGKRCSEIGSIRSFQKKMNEEECLKIYNRAYKTHFARVRSGKMTKAELTEWTKSAKEKLQQVRTGELDISTFQAWLKK